MKRAVTEIQRSFLYCFQTSIYFENFKDIFIISSFSYDDSDLTFCSPVDTISMIIYE